MTPVDEKTMDAARLHSADGPRAVAIDRVEIPTPRPDEALVRVHAAALTRGELDWPVDRLPAIPSYELSGTVTAIGADVAGVAVGDEVWALTAFDRDGVAAEFAIVSGRLLAPKPAAIGHIEAAAIPLPALTAWQALFDHGRLRAGQRVFVHGATGGVGQFATQLARWRGAHVIDPEGGDRVDLVIDTVGGDALARSGALVAPGGRIVSVAEEPPAELRERADACYFIVEPNADQLVELGHLVDEGRLRAAIDSVFPLADVTQAFERLDMRGKQGKVVLRIAAD
jgi:NADPH:quinone reductase-like Zn-dependent oxidoreductase